MPAATEPRRLTRSALNVLSERMVPMGISRCHAATPWGNGSARVCRTPDTLELQLDGDLPRVQFAELGPRRVQLQILRAPESRSNKSNRGLVVGPSDINRPLTGKLSASLSGGRVQLTFELASERPLAFILTL